MYKVRRYISLKNGNFYFVRRVPKGLHEQLGMRRVVFSLRTASPATAAKRAADMASRLDDHWFNLRIESNPAIRKFFRSSADRQVQAKERAIPQKKSVNYSQLLSLSAYSDEAGHAFQSEAGHLFRFDAGHPSLLPQVEVDDVLSVGLGQVSVRFTLFSLTRVSGALPAFVNSRR